MLFGFGAFLVLTVVMFVCRKNLVLFCVFMLLAELGKSMATSPCYAICADTVDEVESLTGKRPQGVMTSFMMCTMKAGTAIAGVVFSAVLHAGHYAAEDATSQDATDCNLYESVLASDADRGRLHGAGIFLQTQPVPKIRKKLEAKRDFSFYTLCAIM